MQLSASNVNKVFITMLYIKLVKFVGKKICNFSNSEVYNAVIVKKVVNHAVLLTA